MSSAHSTLPANQEHSVHGALHDAPSSSSFIVAQRGVDARQHAEGGRVAPPRPQMPAMSEKDRGESLWQAAKNGELERARQLIAAKANLEHTYYEIGVHALLRPAWAHATWSPALTPPSPPF